VQQNVGANRGHTVIEQSRGHRCVDGMDDVQPAHTRELTGQRRGQQRFVELDHHVAAEPALQLRTLQRHTFAQRSRQVAQRTRVGDRAVSVG
jgi:hypothetical protein